MYQLPNATDVFLRLSGEKQKKVFDAAVAEFAAHGYERANTNHIAKRAGVSVGSLFKYFRTKQDLFLALVDYGIQAILAPVIDEAKDAKDALTLFRHMLINARRFALEFPDYNSVYLGLTARQPDPFSTQLARRIEGRTIASYRRAMRKSSEGEDPRGGCLAFVMDNLVLAYQFSFASEYYRARIIGYTGHDPLEEGEEIIDMLIELMRGWETEVRG